jgi:predicted metal-dependent HD superfamily phosphohydrolase
MRNTSGALAYAFDLLSKGPKYPFHNNVDATHTHDVLKACRVLGEMEKLSGEELNILEVAAAYHDTGFILRYKANERFGVRFARSALPHFGYSQNDIETICTTIMATQLDTSMKQQPTSLLQRILCDADLFHFGGPEFHEKTELLRQELAGQGITISPEKWREINSKFLAGHTYFTESARKLRDAGKQANLQALCSYRPAMDHS